MLVDPSASGAGSAVAGAIRQASQATGTSFNYLLATAQVESGLDPHAGASTSSARGLFQFIEQTWLGTIKQSGEALGYGSYADAITKTASGGYQVTDPAMRGEILKLRNDPTANAVMAGAFTKTNADILSSKLGRPPSEGELYIAHFLGVGGAARLISLAANEPNAKAADYFPNAASANSSIFYDRSTGNARSLAQVRNVLTARYDVARSRSDAARFAQTPSAASPAATATAGSPAVATAAAAGPPVDLTAFMVPARFAAPAPAAAATASATPSAAAPDTAGITRAFADAAPKPPAATKDIFRGLFQDSDRPAPGASAVSALWTAPLAAPAEASAAQPVALGTLIDLFKDPKQST